VYGEGPNRLASGDFGEKEGQRFTAQDIRFTTRPGAVYAIALDWPGDEIRIKSLGSAAATKKIAGVRLLGIDENLQWAQTADALTVKTPNRKPCDIAYAFRVALEG